MVKKKTSKSKVKKGSPKIRHLGLKILFGVPPLLFLAFLGFELFKEIATRQDIKKLDQAEAKMRQVRPVVMAETSFERYCSERSVKFSDPGRPTCGVTLSLKFRNSGTIGNDNTDAIIKQLSEMDYNPVTYRSDSDSEYYDLSDIAKLDCYMGDVLVTNYETKQKEQYINIYCQKKFWKKAYPIN